MDDVLKEWNIYTSSCQVCDKENADMLLAEPKKALISRALVHCTVNVLCAEATTNADFMQVLNMVLCGTENNSLLTFSNSLSKEIHKTSFFFRASDHKEMQFEIV